MRSSGDPRPVRVEILPETIEIEWQGGVRSVFRHLALRRMCPCALCREASSPALGPPPVAAGVRALDYSPVGRYALQFHWSDGHDSGIYPYALLREVPDGPG